MNTYNKKISQYALYLLTIGASTTLGLLSFGGMLALWPMLPFAFGAFALSVAYEGEIYLQTIRGAMNKLFDPNFIIHRRGKDYLLKNLQSILNDGDHPKFFDTYKQQCNKVLREPHNKYAQKTLSAMENVFARRLAGKTKNYTEISHEHQNEMKALDAWLEEHAFKDELKSMQSQKDTWFNLKLFSVLAAVFMGMGTIYLLAEAFEAIPFLAAMPFAVAAPVVVCLAILSGAAYGLLTFNAMTNFIELDFASMKLYKNIKKDLSYGETWSERLTAWAWWRGVIMSAGSIALVILAGVLTFCTAGTWMTVVKDAQPIFSVMTRIPTWVMGVINPIITGLSSITFNLLNTAGSLEEIDSLARPEKSLGQYIGDKWEKVRTHLNATETTTQKWNPFRIFLTLIIPPLRIIFFLGHLFAIGLTADRVPGWSQFKSALVGFVCEFFEDLHFFVDHDCGHGGCSDHDHNGALVAQEDPNVFQAFLEGRLGRGHDHSHDLDLPTKLVMYCLNICGVYLAAAAWDYYFSENLTFAQAWEKHWGTDSEWGKPWSYNPVAHEEHSSCCSAESESGASSPFLIEDQFHRDLEINEYKDGLFMQPDTKKIEELVELNKAACR